MDKMSMLKEFHQAFGHPINEEPDLKEIELRMNLVAEEFKESIDEFITLWGCYKTKDFFEKSKMEKATKETKTALSKELSDLLYVVYGTAVSFGLPLDEVFKRVHESNMSKLGEDGKPIYREDGKVLKGPNYKPVDLTDLFNA